MPDGYLISVGVKADFTELKSEQKAAEAALKQAQAEWTEAYAQLGKSAEQGSAQAIAALKEYETALESAKARVASATSSLNAFKAEAAELAAAEKKATESTHSLTNSFYAAQGASRLLKGEMPVRAFERLVAQSELLGNALMKAFPLMGLAGFGMLVVDVIERIVTSYTKVRDAANAAAEAIRTSWAEANETLHRSNNELESSLDSTIAKTEKLIGKKDVSGATAAFDELRRSADQIGKSLDADLKKFDELIKKKADTIGFWGQLFTGKAATTDTEKMLDGIQKKIRGRAESTGDVVDRSEASGNKDNLEHAQTSRIVALQEEYKKATDEITAQLAKLEKAQNTFEGSGKTVGKDQTANINLLAGALRNLEEQQRSIGLEYASGQAKVDALGVIGNKKAKDSTKSSFVDESIAAYRMQAAEEKRITDEIQAYGERLLRQNDEEIKSNEKVETEKNRIAREDLKQRAETSEAAAKSATEQIDAAMQVGEARIEYELSSGAINQQTAAHKMAALHAKSYADKVRALREELEALKGIESAGGSTGKQQASVHGQITATKSKGESTVLKDATKTAKQYEKVWDGAFKQIGHQFASVQSQMMRGQISFANGAKRLSAEMATSAILWAEKAFIGYIRSKAMEAGAHWASESMKTAATATGIATREGIEESADIKSKFKDAKKAARGAYNSVVGIQVVGPILAPIAAAGAFAAVMAFEKGGIIPGSVGSAVPILGHGQEAVLPQPLTKFLVNAANNANGRASNGGQTFHSNNTFNGVADAATFKKMLNKHERDVAQTVKRSIRNGRFS